MEVQHWQHELQRWCEVIKLESITSLRKINGYFLASGLPFDEKFREDFLKISSDRYKQFCSIVDFSKLFQAIVSLFP